jgi:hypothetical protein
MIDLRPAGFRGRILSAPVAPVAPAGLVGPAALVISVAPGVPDVPAVPAVSITRVARGGPRARVGGTRASAVRASAARAPAGHAPAVRFRGRGDAVVAGPVVAPGIGPGPAHRTAPVRLGEAGDGR